MSGALNHDQGKPRVDLLSSKALLLIAEAMAMGAEKYAAHNWRKGMAWSRTYASLQRHLLRWNMGEDIDPESGLPHLALAGCRIMFLLEYASTYQSLDDRHKEIHSAGKRNKRAARKDRRPGKRKRRTKGSGR